METKKIYELLLEAQKKSYSPYSRFRVGAVIVFKNGDVIYGANVENAAYSECICAERTALVQMVMKGYSKDDVDFIAVIGQSDNICTPCGACRQVMSELLNLDTVLYMFSQNGDFTKTTIDDILPGSFGAKDLTR